MILCIVLHILTLLLLTIFLPLTELATISTPLTQLSKANELSKVTEDELLPALHLFQMETAEFYKKLNAVLYQDLNMHFNMSLNSTENDTYEYEDDMGCYNGPNPLGNIIPIVLYSVVCIVGLFGNTLVIYVVLRFSKMQTVTNIYILNLAIADECFLIGIPFLLYTMQTGGWKFGEYMCKAYMVSTSITQFTSSIFLLIMSADRYIAVCHPISSPRFRTPLVSKVVSGIAWLMSALLMLPVILFANTVPNGEHLTCNIKWPEARNTQSGTTFILYTLTLGFATPLTFILIFYCLVIRKLHTVGPKHKSKEKKRSHRKVTKLVLTVITVYIMCWLPYWISQVALINSSPNKCASRLEITIFLLVGCLGYSNSAMNPILYAFLSDNFKKSFMKACTCAARKDVNAQLQLENSLFPKFGKQRQSERLISSNKAKQKKALAAAARNNNASTLLATTTATTTTTTGTSTGQGVSFAGPYEASALVYPAANSSVEVPSANNSLTPNAAAAVLVIATATPSEKDGLMQSSASASSEDSCKPPVLQSDL